MVEVETKPSSILSTTNLVSSQHVERMIEIKQARLSGLSGYNLEAAKADIEQYRNENASVLFGKQ